MRGGHCRRRNGLADDEVGDAFLDVNLVEATERAQFARDFIQNAVNIRRTTNGAIL